MNKQLYCIYTILLFTFFDLSSFSITVKNETQVPLSQETEVKNDSSEKELDVEESDSKQSSRFESWRKIVRNFRAKVLQCPQAIREETTIVLEITIFTKLTQK